MALAAGADLLEAIDWHATECLNASSQHKLDNALKQVLLPTSGATIYCAHAALPASLLCILNSSASLVDRGTFACTLVL
jgi:hypothetical protein